MTVHAEHGLGERRSFRGPAIRRLGPTLRWALAYPSPMTRGVGDGVVVAARVDDEQLRIEAVDSFLLLERLFAEAGMTARVGEAGRWSARIIELLGGAESRLSCQPAVRSVLDLAARTGGATPHELRGAAIRDSGVWADKSVFWSRNDDYPTTVLGVLASRRIIEAAFSYRCPACGLGQVIAADDLGDNLQCNDCEADAPLSLQVVSGSSWRLRTRDLISQNRLRSVLPVASALRLLLDLTRNADTIHYALGIEIEADGRSFEIDFAAFVNDDSGASLVVGEAKARQDLEDQDVSNLEFVQEKLRTLGVECFIAIASSKERLADQERSRLRRSADRFLPTIERALGSGGFLNLPLVLTKESLTVPDAFDLHPLRAAGTHRRDLATLAHWSAQKELGLVGYGDLRARKLEWTHADPTA
ncbi:MAG: hypothetical protein U0Q03_06315 [Acidimicrobiales bacterium]